jgi:hypothetical protein
MGKRLASIVAVALSGLLVSACASSGPATGPSAATVFDNGNCPTWLRRLPAATAYLLNTWQLEHREERGAGRGAPDTFYADAKRAIEHTCAHSQTDPSYKPFYFALEQLNTEIEEPST